MKKYSVFLLPFFVFAILVFLLYFAAGAEELDDQVHQQDASVSNCNQNGGKGAGHAIGALLGKLIGRRIQNRRTGSPSIDTFTSFHKTPSFP